MRDDIQIPAPGHEPVQAYVVRPDGPTRGLAGVVYLHWLERGAANQNRTEFLDEAHALAARGAVAVLPQLYFPWDAPPRGDARDIDAIEAQLAAVIAAYDHLIFAAGVDPLRTAVVGHDYGGMYAGLLAARRPGVAGAVLMASDATWSHWFDAYWLDLPAPDKVHYAGLLAPLDPAHRTTFLGDRLYLQFGADDGYLPADVRQAWLAANPRARHTTYPDTGHYLHEIATGDRIRWLTDRLALAGTGSAAA